MILIHDQVNEQEALDDPELPLELRKKYFTELDRTNGILGVYKTVVKNFFSYLKATAPQKKTLILALKNDIMQGASLSQAMQKHPHDFDVMSLVLIQSGEATGLLISACEKLANYHEKTTALKMRLKKALF